MKTISVSELKAHLSEELRHVAAGEEVVVTDRGRPVARLVPYASGPDAGGLERLAARGVARIGAGIDDGFWQLERPCDPEGGLGAALRAEREEGW